MALLDGALRAVFGAAFSAVFRDGVLRKITETPTGSGGFATTSADYPVKLCLDALSAGDRAESGLPTTAVRLTVLRDGLAVPIDLDDGLSIGSSTFRVVGTGTDPAGAAYVVAAVPA